ncbi:MAG: alpha/beta fold hydrolase [Candidatus Omnitrophica bacterium]|nr:alpha/beta fold hydrolase [Candidatus Omnitrophota bacterium]
MKQVMWWAIFCVGLVIAAFGFAKYLERRAVYFPLAELPNTPADMGLAYENVWVVSGQGYRIHGWFVPGEEARCTVLLFHGNGGNIGHRIEKIAFLHSAGANVYLIDYRGYGKSEGSPSEEGLYRDAFAAYRYLRETKHIPPERIILYGESLGGAVAVHTAVHRPVGGVILEGTFSSGRDLAREYYPWLPSVFFSPLYDSMRKITRVDAPLLFLHSSEDEIIPYRCARRLFARAGRPKRFVTLRGGHNMVTAVSAQEYRGAIENFLARFCAQD